MTEEKQKKLSKAEHKRFINREGGKLLKMVFRELYPNCFIKNYDNTH